MSAHRHIPLSHWLDLHDTACINVWPLGEGVGRHAKLAGRLSITIDTGDASVALRITEAEARDLVAALQWAMAPETTAAPVDLPAEPAIGQPWPGIAGSLYAGIAAAEDGRPDGHIVLLPDEPAQPMDWATARAWSDALGDGARLPTRTESALLYANLKAQFTPAWYWSSEEYEDDGSAAWRQGFNGGGQDYDHKSYEARVRAVRRFDASVLQSFDSQADAAPHAEAAEVPA